MSTQKRMDFSRYPRRDLASGETLFREGDATRELYILLAGEIGVYRKEILVTTIEEPLSIVGELSALTSGLRGATVKGVHQAKLVVVADPDEMFVEYPQMGAKLARLLARRLETMNGKFVELRAAVDRFAAEREMNESPEISSHDLGGDERDELTEVTVPTLTSVGDDADAEPTVDLRVGMVAAALAQVAPEAEPTPLTEAGNPLDGQEDVFDALNAILDWDSESI